MEKGSCLLVRGEQIRSGQGCLGLVLILVRGFLPETWRRGGGEMLTHPGALDEVKAAGDGEGLDVEGVGQVKEQKVEPCTVG